MYSGLKNFIRLNNDKIAAVKTDSIVVTENEHKTGTIKMTDKAKNAVVKTPVIVRSVGHETYALVSNWASYELNILAGNKHINTIVVPMSKNEFDKMLEIYYADILDITAVKVSPEYKTHPPKEWKIKRALAEFDCMKGGEPYVVLDTENLLTDGYSRLLAAMSLGRKTIRVKRVLKGKCYDNRRT